jgi:hypothetical protein
MTRFAKPLTTMLVIALLLSPAAVAVHAQQPEPGQQTMASLRTLIENMGYDYKEYKNDKGELSYFLLTVRSGGGSWKVMVELSPNQENLWIYAELAPISDINEVPRDVLVNMLKFNDSGPVFFGYNEKVKSFHLYQALANRGVTPKLLRERIGDVAQHVGTQEKLWNPRLWTSTGPGPGPITISPEVQRLIDALGSSDELVRLKAAKDLGKLGTAAKPAIPALQRLLQDSDEDVRRVAASSIARIQGTPGPGPGPGPGPTPNTVAGTFWEGNETLSGYGKLKFQFESDGKAIMYDAKWAERGTVGGSWTQTENQLKITFKDCVYEGTVNGDVLSGTARFFENGNTWTFSLTRTTSPTHAAIGSKASLGNKPVPTLPDSGGRHKRP